jgi:hypothetical protein
LRSSEWEIRSEILTECNQPIRKILIGEISCPKLQRGILKIAQNYGVSPEGRTLEDMRNLLRL